MDRVVCGDSLEVLRELPDDCVDCVVTDPPYCSGGVSEASRTAAKSQGSTCKSRFTWFVGDNMGTAGLAWLLRHMAIECFRVTRKTGSMLLFCDWRQVPNLAPAIESAGWRYQNLVVWDKGSMGLGVGFRSRHEMILHMTAGGPEYHDVRSANVIACKRVPARGRVHQTQKPVELLEALIRVVCPPGGVVLDPFAGSCSTAVAARRLGRRFLCIERDPEHCAAGLKRIETEAGDGGQQAREEDQSVPGPGRDMGEPREGGEDELLRDGGQAVQG